MFEDSPGRHILFVHPADLGEALLLLSHLPQWRIIQWSQGHQPIVQTLINAKAKLDAQVKGC